MYVLKGHISRNLADVVKQTKGKTTLWYKLFGHISDKRLQDLAKRGLLGRDKINGVELCEHYLVGKQKGVKFPIAAHTTIVILDYIHSKI